MPGARLTVRERELIEQGVRLGLPHALIGRLIGKHRTTVTREIARGSGARADLPVPKHRAGLRWRGRTSRYEAAVAQARAERRARRPKGFKCVGELAAVVSGLLEADWSPQQIAALLPVLFPDRDDMRVSHETIYRSLFVQTRGQLRRELTAHLRSQRTERKRQGRPQLAGKLIGAVPISARPAEAADRAVPGHWEGDLLLGSPGKGAVITLVERTTRFVLLAPLPDTHKSIDLQRVLTPMIASLPEALRRSLTWDRGHEMARHADISIAADIAIYFADPHSPWQRGSNENINGLLRQYWPKGSDLTGLTQTDCDQVALRLNTRPRQTLNWQTPQQALNRVLGATAA